MRWTAQDSAERDIEVAYADLRLSGWARWAGGRTPEMIGYATVSAFVRAMMAREAELQAGARHLASECSDDEALEVELVVMQWKRDGHRWWKIVRKEYFTGGPAEKKARELGISRTTYQDERRAMQLALFARLKLGRQTERTPVDSAGDFSLNSGKVNEVSPRKARL